MEAFFMLFGLFIMYAFVHGAIIVGKKIENTTAYENFILIFSLVCVFLLVLSSME